MLEGESFDFYNYKGLNLDLNYCKLVEMTW